MAKQLKYDTAITRSEGAVEDYKETLQEIADAVEDNERLIKRLQALPTEITAENYDKATADINAARAAWDELDSSTKTLLNKAGYYELLTNAEAIWEAFTPDTAPVGGDGEEGCKSVLSIGAGAMMILAGAWVAIAARKKED